MVDRTYKQKSQKVQPMDLSLSDELKVDKSDTLRLDTIKKETHILDPTDKYTHWLIPKFTLIAKKARFTP